LVFPTDLVAAAAAVAATVVAVEVERAVAPVLEVENARVFVFAPMVAPTVADKVPPTNGDNKAESE